MTTPILLLQWRIMLAWSTLRRPTTITTTTSDSIIMLFIGTCVIPIIYIKSEFCQGVFLGKKGPTDISIHLTPKSGSPIKYFVSLGFMQWVVTRYLLMGVVTPVVVLSLLVRSPHLRLLLLLPPFNVPPPTNPFVCQNLVLLCCKYITFNNNFIHETYVITPLKMYICFLCQNVVYYYVVSI